MTTENGIYPPWVLRKAANTLAERHDFLLERMARRIKEGRSPDSNAFDMREVSALLVALPLIEAEFDASARLQRSLREEAGFDVLRDSNRYGRDGAWRGPWPSTGVDERRADLVSSTPTAEPQGDPRG